MELIFTEQDGVYSAEFKATADFNIHLEGLREGNVRVYQKSVEDGQYALVRGSQVYPSYGTVYEFDFSGVVYPKWVKVVTYAVNPTLAVVTCPDGEVTQIGG